MSTLRGIYTNPPNIKSGLISWWDLEEISGNKLDSHGSNHLTATNLSYRNFLSTASPNFQSYLSVANNSTIQLASKDFTICCRVALFQSPSVNSNYFFLFSKDNIGSAGREWALYTTSSSDPIANRFIFAIYNQNVGGTVDSINTGQDLSLNTPYWIVCNYNKTTGTISIRVDNGTVNSKTYNNTITHSNTTSPLRLSSAGNNTFGLNGVITKACIYERILSSAEEDFLWNNGKLRDYHEL